MHPLSCCSGFRSIRWGEGGLRCKLRCSPRPTPLRAVLETFLNPRQTKDALRSGLVRVKDQTVKRLNFVVPAGAAVYFQGCPCVPCISLLSQ